MVSLEKTYYVTQIIAVIALIVSLLYIGRQVNQNTTAITITAQSALTDEFVQTMRQ